MCLSKRKLLNLVSVSFLATASSISLAHATAAPETWVQYYDSPDAAVSDSIEQVTFFRNKLFVFGHQSTSYFPQPDYLRNAYMYMLGADGGNVEAQFRHRFFLEGSQVTDINYQSIVNSGGLFSVGANQTLTLSGGSYTPSYKALSYLTGFRGSVVYAKQYELQGNPANYSIFYDSVALSPGHNAVVGQAGTQLHMIYTRLDSLTGIPVFSKTYQPNGYYGGGIGNANIAGVSGNIMTVFATTSGGVLLAKINTETGALEYTRKYTIANAGVDVYEAITDSDGNYVVAGTYMSGLSVNVIGFIMKIAPDGTVIWKKRINGQNSAYQIYITSLVQTSDGNYVMAGEHSDNTFTPSEQAWPFTLKVSSAGSLLWQHNNPQPRTRLNEITRTNGDTMVLAGHKSASTTPYASMIALYKLTSDGTVTNNSVCGSFPTPYSVTLADFAVTPSDVNLIAVDANLTATNLTVQSVDMPTVQVLQQCHN